MTSLLLLKIIYVPYYLGIFRFLSTFREIWLIKALKLKQSSKLFSRD